MTKIEWTEATWNPSVGCSRVSAGCAFCYAFELHDRRHGGYVRGGKLPQQYAKPFDEVQLMPERLEQPLRWRKPRMVFVNSMSDLFHEDVPDEFIARVFAVMAIAKQHTFQVLTKRPERMRSWFEGRTTTTCLMEADETRAIGALAAHSKLSHFAHGYLESQRNGGVSQPPPWPLPNVWLGVSCEDQSTADERIPLLLDTPAAVRWVSAEPLLSLVDLREFLPWEFDTYPHAHRLSWAVCGGESGPRARPCDVSWIRSIVEQCKAAGTPTFCKQLGAKPYVQQQRWGMGLVTRFLLLTDRKGGDPSEWPEDLRVREWPERAHV